MQIRYLVKLETLSENTISFSHSCGLEDCDWNCKPGSVYENNPIEKNSTEGKRIKLIENENNKENADCAHGHLEATGVTDHKAGLYEIAVKRFLMLFYPFLGIAILN